MNGSPALDTLAFLSLPIDPQLCWLISMSLLHCLWQGLLLAFLLAGMLRIKATLSVHQRFVASFVVLILIALSPFVNFLWLSGNSQPPVSVALAHEKYQAGDLALFTLGQLSSETDEVVLTESKATLAATEQPTEIILPTAPQTTTSVNWPTLVSVLITALYLLGAAVMFVRMGCSLRAQRRLSRVCRQNDSDGVTPASVLAVAERAAKSLGRKLKTRIVLFQGQGTALVIGVVRPLILINASLISGLTPKQLEQIIAHELAHIYRWDPLTQFLQRIIECLLFFHPGVWFVSREVSRLREHCCDEWVAGHDQRLDYAETLLQCVALNQNFPATDSRYSLAATGTSLSQLTTRIESLLQPATAPTKQRVDYRLAAILSIGIVLAVGAITSTVYKQRFHDAAATPTPLQEVDGENESAIAHFEDPDWQWQQLDANQLSSSMFLFSGRELPLSDSIPEDIDVQLVVDSDSVRFAQWHFGDANSTRVAIVAEIVDDKIHRLFVDQDRDRTLRADEEITLQTNRDRTWITDLMVEVVENGKKIHSARQVGITPKLRMNALRINTLGHVDGTIELVDQKVAVRRVDNDGNGIPTDPRDQLWIDLDDDGQFDPLTERSPLQNVMEIDGQRYAVRSDRLGHSLNLTADNQSGTVRFQLELADKTAVLEDLEGSLRDESGMLIAIRANTDPVSVPSGRYCIESLVVRVRDAESTLWEMTLTRGFKHGWFDVITDEHQDVKLLESLDFYATPFVDKESRPGQPSWIRPYMHTPNGLVITRFDRKAVANDTPRDGNVLVNFHFQRADETEQKQVTPCQSGFG